MTQPRIIEGTGEELQDFLAQAPKERFRLIFLAPEDPVRTLEQVLGPLLDAADKTDFQPGPPLTDPHKVEVSEMIAAKFRKQGLGV